MSAAKLTYASFYSVNHNNQQQSCRNNMSKLVQLFWGEEGILFIHKLLVFLSNRRSIVDSVSLKMGMNCSRTMEVNPPIVLP